MSETVKNTVLGGSENRPKKGVCLQNRISIWQNRGASDENGPRTCFGEPSGAVGRAGGDDLRPCRSVGRKSNVVLGKGTLQKFRRRRHRPGLRWFSLTGDAKSRLSGAESQATDKQDGKTVFSEQEHSKPADCQSADVQK